MAGKRLEWLAFPLYLVDSLGITDDFDDASLHIYIRCTGEAQTKERAEVAKNHKKRGKMAVLGVKYAEFDGGMLYKGDLKGNPQKIVIHNSASAGNAFSSALYNYNKTMVEGLGTGFAHYYVDDNNIIQLCRDNWVAWHSGKSEMNKMSIGIEICVNPMECYTKCKRGNCDKITTLCAKQEELIKRFFKAEQNAINLIHTLLAKWSLTPEDVIFHSDVKKTECPYFTKKLHNISRGADFLTIFEKPNC